MSDEPQQTETGRNKVTTITRAWRLGGPLSDAQRNEAKTLFIEYLRADHNITLACDYASIARKTAYKWREQDEEFADAWEDAVERSKDHARSSIYQRAILGWDEPVTSMGQVVYEYEEVLDGNGEPILGRNGKPIRRQGKPITIHKWSDSLAVAYAKANLPEHKDKQHIEHTGKDGAPIEVVNVTRERLKQKLNAIKASMSVQINTTPPNAALPQEEEEAQ